MAAAAIPDLPEHLALALAAAPADTKPLFAAAFALDARLGALALRGAEPLLAQIGLAWWREALAAEGADARDPLLRELAGVWTGDRAPLVALVDGWEALALAEDGDPAGGEAFAAGREALARGLAVQAGHGHHAEGSGVAARAWAWADFARLRAEPSPALPPRTRLPRALRPLAVLDGLARRALARGGGPLLGDRLSPLAALRLGLFGV